jgi:poly [ADP-ribose] polymerase 7/11/12/13
MEKDVGAVRGESGDFLARLLGGIFGGWAADLLCCIIGTYWYFFQRQIHAATGIQRNGAQRMAGITMTATFTRETELTPIEIKPELMNPVRNPTAWDKYCNSLSLSDLWESDGYSDKKLYNLNRDCREFSWVKDLFMETMRNIACTITRIERVENAMQHDAYKVQRRNIAIYIAKDTDVSSAMEDQFAKWLFHGTSQENIDTIVKSPVGYNPMLAGSAVGALWGDGTYFAKDAEYSHHYTELKNERKMLLNRVIVGEWDQGAPGTKIFPRNSLVNDVKVPSIFVIQNSNQAYPSYVITYTSA